MKRVIALFLLVLASSGCSDNGEVVGPPATGVDLVVFGTVTDNADGTDTRIQMRISFESIELLSDANRDGFGTREITTGPANVSVLGGRNEFLDAAVQLLESSPVRLRYGAPPEGDYRLAVSMMAQDPNGDVFSFSVSARYDGQSGHRRRSLDDVPRASGAMLIQGIKDGARRSFSSAAANVSIRGMRSLTGDAR